MLPISLFFTWNYDEIAFIAVRIKPDEHPVNVMNEYGGNYGEWPSFSEFRIAFRAGKAKIKYDSTLEIVKKS